MAIEDMTEEEHRETHEKLEMLQSVVRTFELKAKNSQDHSKCRRLCLHCNAIYLHCRLL